MEELILGKTTLHEVLQFEANFSLIEHLPQTK